MLERLILNSYYIMAFLLRCIIVYYTIKTARRSNLIAYYALSVHLFLEGIVNLFLGAGIPNDIPFLLLGIAMAIFIKLTFYKEGNNGPFYLVLIIMISMWILYFILLIFAKNLIIVILIPYIIAIIISIWFFIVSLSAYLKFKANESIKPWIKTRYLLVIGYNIIFIFGQSLFIINNVLGGEGINIFSLGLMISFIILPILQFLAWVMPARFKNWLNRNYTYGDEEIELSDEEIMKTFEGK
ncbi:MAG: hypothetical protein ACFFBP_19755 [Promethearchaeota archaeon]